METYAEPVAVIDAPVAVRTDASKPVSEQEARAYAESRGIEWFDVLATQRLIDDIIAAQIGSDRIRMQQIVDLHASGHHNYIKAFINAKALGITGTEILNGMRRDFIDCLCGKRFDSPNAPGETPPSTHD